MLIFRRSRLAVENHRLRLCLNADVDIVDASATVIDDGGGVCS